MTRTSLDSDSATVVKTAPPALHIRPFRAGDAHVFRTLNELWIRELFGMEAEDSRVLDNPELEILGRGGHIVVGEIEGAPVGCCALMLVRPGVYEVAKMAVDGRWRGSGIGRQILAYVIALAEKLGAVELELCTNRRLANAIHLYESLGFQHLPPERAMLSPFARADVFMEMHIKPASETTTPGVS